MRWVIVWRWKRPMRHVSQTASVPLNKQATSRDRGSRPVANEAGLNALAEQIPPSTRRSRRRHTSSVDGTRHRWRRRIVVGLVALLVVIGGGAGYVYYGPTISIGPKSAA